LLEARILGRAGIVGVFDKGYRVTGGASGLALSRKKVDAKARLAKWGTEQVLSIALGEALERLEINYLENPDKTLSDISVQLLDAAGVGHALLKLNPPGAQTLDKQLQWVLTAADLRGERSAEIAAQQGWPLGAWMGLLGMRPSEHQHTILLMRVAQDLVVQMIRRIKHLCDVPRPSQLSPQVHPVVDVPEHGSWPGGHAAEGFMAATLLHELIVSAQMEPVGQGLQHKMDGASRDLLRQQLDRLAARIAYNRVVAGLHFPADTLVGFVMGRVLAHYLVQRCRNQAVNLRGEVEGHLVDAHDFSLVEVGSLDPVQGTSLHGASLETLAAVSHPNPAPTLEHLWIQAQAEWS
jgi:hypothetical protein